LFLTIFPFSTFMIRATVSAFPPAMAIPVKKAGRYNGSRYVIAPADTLK